MHWTESTTFDDSRAAPEKPFRDAGNVGQTVHEAIRAIKKENLKFENVPNKYYNQLQIDPANPAGLIDLIATAPFQHADRKSSRHCVMKTDVKDILVNDPESSRSDTSSALIGDLCAFAVKNSSGYIHGIDFHFGKEPLNTFTRAQHPDQPRHVSNVLNARRTRHDRGVAFISAKSLLFQQDQAFQPDVNGLIWRSSRRSPRRQNELQRGTRTNQFINHQ